MLPHIPIRYALVTLLAEAICIGVGFVLDRPGDTAVSVYTYLGALWCIMLAVTAIWLLTRRNTARIALRSATIASYIYLSVYVAFEIMPDFSNLSSMVRILTGMITLLTALHWFMWRISYHPWLFVAPSAHDTTSDDILDF